MSATLSPRGNFILLAKCPRCSLKSEFPMGSAGEDVECKNCSTAFELTLLEDIEYERSVSQRRRFTSFGERYAFLMWMLLIVIFLPVEVISFIFVMVAAAVIVSRPWNLQQYPQDQTGLVGNARLIVATK